MAPATIPDANLLVGDFDHNSRLETGCIARAACQKMPRYQLKK
jgi:hypothetical protein